MKFHFSPSVSEMVCPLCSCKQQGSILVSLCLVKERFKECFQQVNTMIKDGVIKMECQLFTLDSPLEMLQ